MRHNIVLSLFLLILLVLVPLKVQAQGFNIFAKQKVVIGEIIDKNDRPLSDAVKQKIYQSYKDAFVNSDNYEVYEVNIEDIKLQLTQAGKTADFTNICKQIGEKADYIIFTSIKLTSTDLRSTNTQLIFNSSLYRISTATEVLSDVAVAQATQESIISTTSELVSKLLGIEINKDRASQEKALVKTLEDAAISKDLSEADKKVKNADEMAKHIESLGNNVKTMDFFNLGRAYYSAAQVATVMEKKVELFKKADAAFAMVAERAPEDYRGNLWRARAHSGMDPETELGLAKPFYEKVVEMLEAKGDKSNTIIEAYQYLGYYNYLKEYAENPQGAKYIETRKWWGKILEINPEHSIKEAMSLL